MQSNDFNYKNYIKDILYTFAPLHSILKLFCLNCQVQKYKSPHCEILKRATPALIIGSVNLFTLYYKLTYVYNNVFISVRYTDIVQIIYDIFQYVADLVFVHKYGAEICYEYIKQYACIDRLIGTDFYGKIRRSLIKAMMILIIMWILSSLFDYVIWLKGFGFIQTSVFSIAYVYMFIKILTNLDLTANVIHIESRLSVLGDIIQDYCNTTGNSSEIIEDFVAKKDWLYYNESKSVKLRSIKVNSGINKNYVKTLSQCYFLLLEQVRFINKMFGMRMLLNSLSLLIDIIRFTNLAVLILIGSQGTGYANEYYTVIATLGRSLTCIIVLLSIVSHCERAYRQRERIIRLLDNLIINKNLDETLSTAFNDFRSLVQSRSINFHMANYIRIEYPLLVSITSAVVTYTIILLQSS